jgi:hypothetical protein
MAVPSDEPRFDTLRDSPLISPWRFSGNADCTTFTEGVSITPIPSPMRNNPGAKAQTLGELATMARNRPIPAIVPTKPAMISVRCWYFFGLPPLGLA